MTMRTPLTLVGLLLLVSACGGGGTDAPVSGAVAYEGATVITGDGGPPLGGGVIVVENRVITDIGLAANVTVPDGATVVDLTGKTVMPTLVDLHGHIGFVDGMSFDNANYTREVITDQLDRYAYHGVGVIVSLGTDPGELAFEIQADQQAGTVGGAMLHTAFRGIARPDAGPGAPTLRPTALGASTEEEARAVVREIAATNADFVKIWVDDRGGSVEKLGPDLYRPIIEEAHANDLRVIAHIFVAEDARELVEAGVDGFAHLARDVEMDDELVAAIVENGVFVMPNLAVSERARNATPPAWADHPMLAETVAPDVVARIRQSYEDRSEETAAAGTESFAVMLRTLKKLADAGATLVLGADTGIQDHVQGYMEHYELELIVEAGISPARAIQIATSAPAEVLGVNTGLLAPGKRADFIVLDANPIYGIENTRQISSVFLGGEELDREGLRARWAGQ
jgi:imidazolonepropionase-like amidohydrolase